MNREIEFRGKRVDNGEWVYGYLRAFDDGSYHITTKVERSVARHIDGKPLYTLYGVEHEVYPETVGQCTNRKDDHGVEIFHGDILSWTFSGFDGNFYDEPRVGVVKWSDDFLALVIADNLENDCFGSDLIYFGDAFKASGITRIIGTVYDNPELLEVTGDE